MTRARIDRTPQMLAGALPFGLLHGVAGSMWKTSAVYSAVKTPRSQYNHAIAGSAIGRARESTRRTQ